MVGAPFRTISSQRHLVSSDPHKDTSSRAILTKTLSLERSSQRPSHDPSRDTHPFRRSAPRPKKTTRTLFVTLSFTPLVGRSFPPLRSAPRPVSAASHRAPANRERTRHPSPFSLSTTTRGGRFRRECLRGSFGREMFARAFWAGDVGGRCPFTRWLLLLLLLRHPSRGDRDRTVLVEWRVVKRVVALVWKVTSWREWSDCWRCGVNGVIVEMLVVARFVVVLCIKITIGKEKRLTEDRSP